MSGYYEKQETAISVHYLNHRLGQHCETQQAHTGLRDLARAHSKDLAEHHSQLINQYPDGDARKGHIGSDGKMPAGPDGRITALGFNHQGENAFWYQGKPADAVGPAWNFWTHSSGHLANLNNCTFKNHGIGIYYNAATGWTYLTHDFGG
ncbi:CAP domain-containing protein [Actinomadura kijaniata]|uniref:CAP domain-containing protein n=1 Tax=Actinomadura kijaniata TaxID=46161 RepID=UPI00083227C7|nr:CAP domain-containing protein [Actinomadura kijaniata]